MGTHVRIIDRHDVLAGVSCLQIDRFFYAVLLVAPDGEAVGRLLEGEARKRGLMKTPEQARTLAPPCDREEEGVESLVQRRLHGLPQVRLLLGREDVRLVHDRAGDRVPELEAPLGAHDAHGADPVGIDELVPADLDQIKERPRLDEAPREVEDDARLIAGAGGAEDVGAIAPGQELIEAKTGGERDLPLPLGTPRTPRR
jgi:hypothetical protein